MSDAQTRAVELARFYFRRIAESAGWSWDGDNDVEVELMVCHIIDAATERLRPQLDDAIRRIRQLEDALNRQMPGILGELRMLDGLRPTCVICTDAAAARQTSRGPACTDCAGDLPDGCGPDPDRPETWPFEDDEADEELAREAMETAMSASERAEYDRRCGPAGSASAGCAGSAR